MTQLEQNSAAIEPVAAMPDVAIESRPQLGGQIDWVGMSSIDVPLKLLMPESISVTAKVQAYVSLDDPAAKGIHMSRLYLAIDEGLGNQELTPASLFTVLGEFLESHQGLSTNGLIELKFDLPLRRNALLSDNSGFKSYPCMIRAASSKGEIKLELGVDVAYSSTCPCSAALARQLIQQGFDQTFAGQAQVDAEAVRQWLGTVEGVRATPHSQRSKAQLLAAIKPETTHLPILQMIDQVEQRLGTPVQTAVKRVDEQEFARLNGQNLMFCEDAVRRVHETLDAMPELTDFWIRVNHYESLHAHDAVAIKTKGVVGGYHNDPGASSSL